MEDDEKSLDIEGYSLLPDIVWNPVSDVKNSQFGKIVFTSVEDFYPVGRDLRCTYIILTEDIKYDPDDRIVIYCVGWTNVEDCVTWLKARKPEEPGCELTVLFPAKSLPEPGSRYYQFCYLKSGEICGASVPFNFVKNPDCSREIKRVHEEQLLLKPLHVLPTSDYSVAKGEREQASAEAGVTKELESIDISYHIQDSDSDSDNDFETVKPGEVQHKEIVTDSEQIVNCTDEMPKAKENRTEPSKLYQAPGMHNVQTLTPHYMCNNVEMQKCEQKSNETAIQQMRSDANKSTKPDDFYMKISDMGSGTNFSTPPVMTEEVEPASSKNGARRTHCSVEMKLSEIRSDANKSSKPDDFYDTGSGTKFSTPPVMTEEVEPTSSKSGARRKHYPVEMKLSEEKCELKKLLNEQIEKNNSLKLVLFETEQRANNLVKEISCLKQEKDEEIKTLKLELNEMIDKNVTLCDIISQRNEDIKVLNEKFLNLTTRHIELQNNFIKAKLDTNLRGNYKQPEPVSTVGAIFKEQPESVTNQKNICSCSKKPKASPSIMSELGNKMDFLTQLVKEKNKIEMESYELLCLKISILEELEEAKSKKEVLQLEQERAHIELQNAINGDNESSLLLRISDIVKQLENCEEKTVNVVTNLSEIELRQSEYLKKCLELKIRNNDFFQSVTQFGCSEDRTGMVRVALEETFQGIKILDKKLDILVNILSNAASPRLIDIIPLRVLTGEASNTFDA